MASQMSTSSMLTSSRKSTCSEMRAATLSVAGREKSSLDSYAPSKSNMLCRVLAPTSVPSTSILAAAMPRKALRRSTFRRARFFYHWYSDPACGRASFRLLIVQKAPQEQARQPRAQRISHGQTTSHDGRILGKEAGRHPLSTRPHAQKALASSSGSLDH